MVHENSMKYGLLKSIRLIFVLLPLIIIIGTRFVTADTINVSNFDELKEKIEAASGEQTTIRLAAGEYIFSETLNINEKNIIFEPDGNVKFKRSASFDKTFLNIDSNSTVNFNSDKITFDGEKKKEKIQDNKASFIITSGKLEINGTNFINAHTDKDYPCHGIAPIRANGKDASIVFNSGKIANTTYDSTHGGGNWYSAGGIYLSDGATLTMNGGSIEGCFVSSFDHPSFVKNKWANYMSAGAVMVDNGSHFVMNGGVLNDNLSTTGAVMVGTHNIYDIHRGVTDHNKLKKLPIATFEMNGGTISNNSGAGRAGGVHIFANAEAKMNGGEIIKNKGYAGGGVITEDAYTQGIQGVDQTQAKTPYEAWKKLYPAAFEMNGGKISNNLAYTCGGGIDVASDGVVLKGGEIKHNKAGDQGGGVYVTALPYKLNVESAYISDNLATKTKSWIHSGEVLEDDGKGGKKKYRLTEGAGGGAWFCPTGNAIFYAENGAVFDNNNAEIAGSDFHNEELVPTIDYSVKLPDRTAAGTVNKWYLDKENNRYTKSNAIEFKKLDNFKESTSLKAIFPEDKGAAKNLVKLVVSGNSANKGGGFGSNGTIIFGKIPTEDNPLKDIEIEKSWGKDTPSKEVEIELRARIDDNDWLIEKVVLNNRNNFKSVVKNLPATIDGKNIEEIVYIKELNSTGYDVKIKEIEEKQAVPGGNKQFVIKITNTHTPKKPPVPSKPENPKTGDHTNVVLYTLTGLLSMILIIITLIRKHKSY